ncbi:MAG: c-type cytochrome [Alphaproteobacteria bacterium]|nr:c-type cytochrome [Alphaproteobacteria bacterium]
MSMLRPISAILACVLGFSATSAWADGDPAAGRRVFVRCVACHQVNANGSHTVGPNLYRVVGRKAGTVAGYDFKSKLKGSDIIWTEDALEKFLANPKPLIEGTSMQTFPGLPVAKDREDLISYLKDAGK